ncbi:lipopolysaccharide biosynthesis protein [Leptothrix discophora]|uniref:Oligosaccharide flippase family protein n=1 Tax=Leptothrix discophora TaxID=89 RepID=A0ABT9G060_LEPDI|nr:oligosaccharide flippase family protein [Leptothrix discophora]MDP4299856.1 oligosaccharide flippase family protein [Leptothrix discophora]
MADFKRNLVASYLSQIYVAIVGIVIVPFYIRYMGTEAYGLVGFYAMLQAWFQLLDMGLSPTLSRQTARLSGGAITALELRRLLRVLEGIFYGVALLGTVAIGLGADWIATRWLQAQSLPLEQVTLSVELMACIVGLRWVAGLYRGAIGGFEQQVWLGRLNASTATARFVVVLAIFEWLGTTPAHFFGWQLMVALMETTLLCRKTYMLLPRQPPDSPPVGWHWVAMRDVVRFSMSIAFTSAVWVGVTQIDKLVLSKFLPLAEYGHFTLAVLVASGVTILSNPLSMALLPRLSRIHAEGDESRLLKLYRQATQGMVLIAMPVSATIGFGSQHLIYSWTGNHSIAQSAAPITTLYAIGNGLLSISAFPYYLQYAKGNIRLHLIGNVFFAAILLPTIVLASRYSGGIGAAWSWAGSNLFYLIVWTAIVHRKLSPGLHRTWMLKDVAPIGSTAVIVSWLLIDLSPWPAERLATFAQLCAIGTTTILASGLMSSTARDFVKNFLRNKR